jgi:uncharacterized spore protein YtfJ
MTDSTSRPDARRQDLPEFMQPLVDKVHSSAKTDTVFGASRDEGGGRSIIPVAKVAYGFGGGFGTSSKKGKAATDSGTPGGDEGTGGGAGIKVDPLGVFELTDLGVRFVPLRKSKVVAIAALLGGLILGVLIGKALKH